MIMLEDQRNIVIISSLPPKITLILTFILMNLIYKFTELHYIPPSTDANPEDVP
jgi:hypothetical protein